MLSDEQLALLKSVLNELIPASKGGTKPAAGDLGVADFICNATRYCGDPVALVTVVLRSVCAHTREFTSLAAADRVAVLKRVESEHEEAFSELVRLTYMGYYSRADIRPLFGVAAHAVHPRGYDVAAESEELMHRLTAPVRARGSVYRNPDSDQPAS